MTAVAAAFAPPSPLMLETGPPPVKYVRSASRRMMAVPARASMLNPCEGSVASGPVCPKPEIEQTTSSGRRSRSSAKSMPISWNRPGWETSTMTSACSARRRNVSRSSARRRSRPMLRLPRLSTRWWKDWSPSIGGMRRR